MSQDSKLIQGALREAERPKYIIFQGIWLGQLSRAPSTKSVYLDSEIRKDLKLRK